MTDDHIMQLWADAYNGYDKGTFVAASGPRVLRFATLIRKECERVQADRIAALEGDVDEAEQRVVDLLCIEKSLKLRLENLEREAAELRAERDLHRKAYWAYEPRNPQPVINGPQTETAP